MKSKEKTRLLTQWRSNGAQVKCHNLCGWRKAGSSFYPPPLPSWQFRLGAHPPFLYRPVGRRQLNQRKAIPPHTRAYPLTPSPINQLLAQTSEGSSWATQFAGRNHAPVHSITHLPPCCQTLQGMSHRSNPEENALDFLPKLKTKTAREKGKKAAIKHSLPARHLPFTWTAVMGSIQTSYPLSAEVKS